MSAHGLITSYAPARLLMRALIGCLCCAIAWAQEPDEPELPLADAMAAVDEIAPLPDQPALDPAQFTEESILLVLDAPLDYTFLKYLQIQERVLDDQQREEEEHRMLFERFFSEQRDSVIYDPAEILTDSEKRVLVDSVQSYQQYDLNPVFVNILGEEQVERVTLAPNQKHEEILQQHPRGILIYYFYGLPERTLVYYSKGAYRDVARDQQQRIAQSAMQAADVPGDAYYSIYRHLTSFTDGLTQHYREVRPELFAPMTTVPTGIPIARGTPSQPPADPEVAGLPLEEPEAGRPRVNVVLIVCLLCLVAGIAYGGYLLKKFRKPKPKVFRIEVQECPPQLGFKVAKGTSKAYHYGQEETEQ